MPTPTERLAEQLAEDRESFQPHLVAGELPPAAQLQSAYIGGSTVQSFAVSALPVRPKSCVSCAHCALKTVQEKTWFRRERKIYVCRFYRDLVTAEPFPCEDLRHDETYCGAEGRAYSPRQRNGQA